MKYEIRPLKSVLIMTCVISSLFLVDQTFAAQECQITLSDSNLDFGRVTRPGSNDPSSFKTMHLLGNRSVSLNAICPQPAKLALHLRGLALGEQFRFAQHGLLGVTLSNASLDGSPVDLAKVPSIGSPPESSGSSIEAMPGDRVIPVSGGRPVEGSVLSIQVELKPLVPLAELRTLDTKTLESNLTFQINSY